MVSVVIPDVANATEVVCPCGQYRVTVELLVEVGWPAVGARTDRQVVSPCCGLLLEVFDP